MIMDPSIENPEALNNFFRFAEALPSVKISIGSCTGDLFIDLDECDNAIMLAWWVCNKAHIETVNIYHGASPAPENDGGFRFTIERTNSRLVYFHPDSTGKRVVTFLTVSHEFLYGSNSQQ